MNRIILVVLAVIFSSTFSACASTSASNSKERAENDNEKEMALCLQNNNNIILKLKDDIRAEEEKMSVMLKIMDNDGSQSVVLINQVLEAQTRKKTLEAEIFRQELRGASNCKSKTNNK